MAMKKGKSKSGKYHASFQQDGDDNAFNDNYKYQQDLQEEFKGSLSSKYLVLVTLKENPAHPLKARIISCRLSQQQQKSTSKTRSQPIQELTDASYDYYISFIDLDRRNDCWKKRTDLIPTNEISVDTKHCSNSNGNKNQALRRIETEENHEHEGCKEEDIERHREATKIKTIERVKIGMYVCEAWYYSPYPRGFHNIEMLHVCEFCLSFFVSESEKDRHDMKCGLTHPPGDEIYRDDANNLSVFEIDGRKNKVYVENLAYLAKLFLDHKKLWRDMDPFIFYILCENHHQLNIIGSSNDNTNNTIGGGGGYGSDRNSKRKATTQHVSRIVGYFSKEKSHEEEFRPNRLASNNTKSNDEFNLSCILVLPCHQRKGYGKFLISFSYELSLIDGKLGTPERPLSDLGRASYYSWWTQRIIECINSFLTTDKDFSLTDISKVTGIVEKDILWTLIIICTDSRKLKEIYDDCGKPGVKIHAQDIRWVPHKPKWTQLSDEPIFPLYDPCLHLFPINTTPDESTSVSSVSQSDGSYQKNALGTCTSNLKSEEYTFQYESSVGNVISLRKVYSNQSSDSHCSKKLMKESKKKQKKNKQKQNHFKKLSEQQQQSQQQVVSEVEIISPRRSRNSSHVSGLSMNEMMALSTSSSKSTDHIIHLS